MIQSFRCKHTQALFEGGDPPRFRASKSAAVRKLAQLDAALTLDFLRAPPGNHLEALRGDRRGQYSIRVNAAYESASSGRKRVQPMSRSLITTEVWVS
jgi:proteic killer suppression protein